MAQKEQKLRDDAKAAKERGDDKTYNDLTIKADKQQHDMVLFDSITGAIYGPNTNGGVGYVARAAAPELSYRIGQYYKGNAELNKIDGGNRNEEGSAPHIIAHGILAAAVSYATGNDVTTGALSAMSSEAGAKYVSRYLYQTDDPSKLTAEQKQTVSSITGLAGLGLGATTGSVSSAVNAAETGKIAVDNNVVQALGAACGPATPLCVAGIAGGVYLATPSGQENLRKGATIASSYLTKAYESVKNGIYSTVDDYYLDELKGWRSGGDGRLEGDVNDIRDSINAIGDKEKREKAISILGDSVDARQAEKTRRGGLDKGHQDRLDAEEDLLKELKK